jgi:ribonuclease T1
LVARDGLVTRRSKSILTVAVAVGGIVILIALVLWVQRQGYVAGAASTGTGPYASTSTTQVAGTSARDPETNVPWIEVADLPSQGRAVLALIDKGGPYPYSQDGGTFTNAERLLPLKAKGFYTEYTVKLPSSSDRGPVRIIMGGKGQWYLWTDDHYASFSRIRR